MSGRVFSSLLFLTCAVSAARAENDRLLLNGFMCVKPFYSVDCVDLAATYMTNASISSCQQELTRYVAATVDYRECLQRQISDAIHQANDVLERFRCVSEPKTCRGETKER
jgi:hypothetical protein